jgi:hypothetical protein
MEFNTAPVLYSTHEYCSPSTSPNGWVSLGGGLYEHGAVCCAFLGLCSALLCAVLSTLWYVCGMCCVLWAVGCGLWGWDRHRIGFGVLTTTDRPVGPGL